VPTPVEATKHLTARRKNIPTTELEAFVVEAEKKPPTALYPRNPSLDPQLVWNGKDTQDRQDLQVPVVPIYIQEKIAPRAIVEELRANARSRTSQVDLFGDFNGLEFEQLIEFYEHSQRWSNRMILGDSLLAMTSLSEKEGLRGLVQMIYVDPPYGIKFGSNWQVSTRKHEVKDRPEDVTRQPEQVRAFRDTWQLGIHSYLSYLRDRFMAARELLADSGSIFVQIGDENSHLVRALLDEVFGSSNFVAFIAFKKKKMPLGEAHLFTTSDYLLWYARDIPRLKFRRLFLPRDKGTDGDFNLLELEDGSVISVASLEDHADRPAGARLLQSMDLRSAGRTESCVFNFTFAGKDYFPSEGKSWKTNLEGMNNLRAAGRLLALGESLRYKLYWDDYPVQELSHMWMDTQGATDKEYVVQTSTKVVERCMLLCTDPGDLILDPTCGSGTTAYVAEQWGRRWITIDTSRVALALARTRLMSARFPYYILKDSAAGIVKDAEISGSLPVVPMAPSTGDVRHGFVCERVPHVTLGSIANNTEIREGMSRTEIEAVIKRTAESERLYDRPAVDPRVVRVTGPFTVEGLSPHRVLSESATPTSDASAFVSLILENLRTSGVQNTVKGERLIFDRLEPWPGGLRVQAAGEYREDGKSRPVAVAIGPEFGTVGVEFVREAAKEAIRFADLLVVCGFAFEANAMETQRLGALTILRARMNPDLAMSDELLKRTGSGNLFTVFGEPDVAIKPAGQDLFTIEIRGVDVYDPTTGVVRNHTTDDIATWFVDTNYNGESFFVRHAYFLGADDPYEKLRRVLGSEIDRSAWDSLYSTTSRPFARPTTGKVAVKVINHYGDEVMKVYDC